MGAGSRSNGVPPSDWWCEINKMIVESMPGGMNYDGIFNGEWGMMVCKAADDFTI